jgi:hypothetical protein
MTNSESLLQFGNNAYAKPATALNILRETSWAASCSTTPSASTPRRWKFKRPMPADFFRTMEDASASTSTGSGAAGSTPPTTSTDTENNHFPRRIVKSRFELFKESQQRNEMQKAKKPEAKKPETKEPAAEKPDVKEPKAKTPEAKAPEAKTPGAQ